MLRYAFAILATATALAAQSVIISAPSTDITRHGEIMLAHESQFNRYAGGKNYWSSFTFGTIGLTKDTEIAATLYGPAGPPRATCPWESV